MEINYLAIIPARAGSKGIPNKNIKRICGKTLIEITVNCANKVNKIEISDVNIKALYRHPYIGKELTIRLLAFKKFHKKISLNDFAEMQTIAPIQRKILPLYLMFDQSVK